MSEIARPATSLLAVRLGRTALGASIYTALAFAGAGTLDWPRGWIYAGAFVAVSIAGSAAAQLANPELMAARAKGMRGDTKRFDRLFYAGFLPLITSYPLVAGLDAIRFGWAPLPGWTVAPGLLLFVAGSVLSTWTLLVNNHAESTVRIQSDRAHTVVRDGPYGLVRHPMYLGTLLGLPGTALILGSAWALVAVALITALFTWRTAQEDRALQQELPGYTNYASVTRYRLLPGVW
ncbi:methyltransferase family protein [Rhodopseudomonas palustris]|nr:isoprenylcysteine carboxylmethyltransferase family protein [Rhodopseudomonas palustris]